MRSDPSGARSPSSGADAGESFSDAERQRAREPSRPLHWTSSGAEPGCASTTERMSRITRAGSVSASATSSRTAICPAVRSSARRVTDSTMNVGASTPWSRREYPPLMSTGTSGGTRSPRAPQAGEPARVEERLEDWLVAEPEARALGEVVQRREGLHRPRRDDPVYGTPPDVAHGSEAEADARVADHPELVAAPA